MAVSEIRKYLHEMNNHLNSAMLNALLLRQLHGNVLDGETMLRLESALREADRITKEFQNRIQAAGSGE